MNVLSAGPVGVLRGAARRATAQDAAMAGALLAACLVVNDPPGTAAATAHGYIGEVVGGRLALAVWWAASAATLGAVVLRRRRPAAMLAAGTVSAVVHAALGMPMLIDLGVLLLLGTVAARCRRRVSLAALAVLLVLGGAWSTWYAVSGRPVPGLPSTVVRIDVRAGGTPPDAGPVTVRNDPVWNSWYAAALLGPALFASWAVGSGARNRSAYLDQLRVRAADLEHERDRQATLAAATERARISREMHDVVAHGLSVIVIQAQVAEASLDDPPEETRSALDAIVAIGRESLADMRRVLAAVADADDTWHPQPGLAQLPALLGRVSRAGTPVRIRIEGTPVELPASVDVSAYRIAQEALTNTIRHAGSGAKAELVVGYASSEVSIEVRDDGRGLRTDASGDGPGLGLRGMRERVGLLGGRFAAGPATGGGFAVRATLPLHRPERGGLLRTGAVAEATRRATRHSGADHAGYAADHSAGRFADRSADEATDNAADPQGRTT